MADLKDQIEQRVEDARQELAEAIRVLDAIYAMRGLKAANGGDCIPPLARLEYVNLRPIEAIERYLDKIGEPVPAHQIIDEIVRGGGTINKTRGRANIRIGIENAIVTGRLLIGGVDIDRRNLKQVQHAVAENLGKIRRNPKSKK